MERKSLPGILDTGPLTRDVFAIRDAQVNLFIVRGPEGLVCIDTGWRPQAVMAGFDALHLDIHDVVAVLLTHGHWDHAQCSEVFTNARVYQGRGGKPAKSPRILVRNRECISVAGLEARAIATPGHTPDSMSWLIDGRYLFTGDAIFLRKGKVFPFPSKFNDDQEMARRSIRKLSRLKGIEHLITAHTGATNNYKDAFR
ncbi:MBL fold metallo-hydrolase [bacterium]|nr:MBL fold metallo-hydrolase [bacterium]